MLPYYKKLTAVSVLAFLSFNAVSATRVIDFDYGSNGQLINHGDIIASQYQAWGLTVESCLIDGAIGANTDQTTGTCAAPDEDNVQLAFNTALTNTQDTDLQVRETTNAAGETIFVASGYDDSNPDAADIYNPLSTQQDYYENLFSDENDARRNAWLSPGNVLILNESDRTDGERASVCTTVACSNPDDEGSRPAGFFKFVFDRPVDILNLDFFDIERDESELTVPNSTIFFSIAGQSTPFTTTVPDTDGDRFKRVEYTNLFNVTSFVLNMPGSGAIDNLVFRDSASTDVNAPLTTSLFLLGLAGLAIRRKN